MKQSKLFAINWRDILRGLAMAALTPVLTTITNSLDHGEFTLNWHLIYLSAVGGAAAYILKNFLTPEDKK